MSADITPYLDLITPSQASQPDFMATVALSVQPFADIGQAIAGLVQDFDLDNAVGAQLDAVGVRVGATRNLQVPLTGVYFAWDTVGLGWDEGSWQGPYDPSTGLVTLPDAQFRALIKFAVVANIWDGSVEEAYAAYAGLLGPDSGVSIVIQDNGDMTMYLGVIGNAPDAIIMALLTEGSLLLKPAGVLETILLQPVGTEPFFGWDVENASISGWDVGAWGVPA